MGLRRRYLLAQSALRVPEPEDEQLQSLFGVEASRRFLNDSVSDMDSLRSRYTGPDSLDSQLARISIAQDHEKVYTFAIESAVFLYEDAAEAFFWLERLKSRSFLGAIGLRPLRPAPSGAPSTIERKQAFLKDLSSALDRAAAVSTADQLEALWKHMEETVTVEDYLSIRRGRPLGWHTIQKELLHV